MDWSPEINEILKRLLTTTETQKIAVFDADGTLWHDDLGEAFFGYQVLNKLAPGVAGMHEPWKHYRSLDLQDTSVSSAWLAQICAGLKESELLQQSRDFYQNHFGGRPTPPLRKLIFDLQAKDFELWICTASPVWSIEPCLQELKIPRDHLIGTEVVVDSKGVLTNVPVLPIPYKAGKKMALEKKLKGPPLFVAGNSMGDLEMMTWATQVSLTVIYEPHRPPVEASEKELMRECQKRKWPLQIFKDVKKL